MKLKTLLTMLIVVLLCPALRAAEPPAPRFSNVGDPYPIPAGMGEYVDGLRSLEAFELSKAVDQFTTALTKAAERSDILLARGLANLLQEKIADGQKDIQTALDLNPRGAEARRLYLFSMSMANRGDVGRRVYNFSSQDSFDRMLQNVSGSYASAIAQPAVNARSADTARRGFPTVASEYAHRLRQTVPMGRALYSRGMEAYRQNQPELAVDHLAMAAEQFPDDASVLTVYGLALAAAGDRDRSREVLSTALTFNSTIALAYEQRAICAARMGNLKQAKQDLAIGKLLDTREGALKNAEKVIAEAEAAMPAESASALLTKLIDASTARQPMAQLVAIADPLFLAANATRVEGFETYQQRMRPLQWWTLAEPKNPDRFARLGLFVLDELDVRGDWIDPGRNWTYYRKQSKQKQTQELELARSLFKQALGANSMHVPAMMGLAKIKYRENLWGDSEQLVRQAMSLKPNDPEILDYMSQLMKIAAGQAMARALAEATPRSWTETVGNWEYRYTQYGDYAKVAEYGAQSDGLLGNADAYLKAALQALQDTPQSYDFIGTLAFRRQKYDAALTAYQSAVKKVPDSIEYHYALANAYAKLNQIQPYLEEATIGRCLEQTTGSAYLQMAWRNVASGDFTNATPLVTKAMQIDPIDTRNLVFMAAIAEGQTQTDKAIGYYNAALAVEQARGKHRDASYLDGTGRWTPNEIGLTMALRMRLARHMDANDPAEALKLYTANLALEPRLTSAKLIEPVPSAILPEANRDGRAGAPSVGGMLRTCRVLEAITLYRLNRKTEAADAFRRLEFYDEIAALGGARRTAATPLGGSVVATPDYAQMAVECFREVGDTQSANRWARQAELDRREDLRRREIPQPPQSLQPRRNGRL